MITHSGIRVAPDSDGVPSPKDIAVAMGRITRYAGAVWCPLVAHSFLVAELVLHALRGRPAGLEVATRKETWAWALLHDAHETVTGEVARPWKPGDLRALQRGLDERISAAYGLDLGQVDLALVKKMDERSLCLEAEVLGLPGFREIYTKVELGGSPDDYPQLETGEVLVADRLFRTMFTQAGVCTHAGGPVVAIVAGIFERIHARELVQAIEEFDGIMGDLRSGSWRRA